MAIKHATLSAALAPGAKLGPAEWDAGHVVEPGTIAFADLAAVPTTLVGHGITDGITAAAVAAAYQPLSAVLTATTASYTTAEKTKLGLIAAGATANSPDATLLDRANHTGTQDASSITGLATVATSGAFADLTGKPITLAGYGISDGVTASAAAAAYQPLDAGLTSLAGAAGTNALYYLSAADTWSAVTIGANLDFTSGILSASGGGGGSSTWGSITGTLSSQTDLQTALDGKSNTGHTHSFADLTSKPTTLVGYGVTDAVNTTSTQTIGGKKVFTSEIDLAALASDPSSPTDGELWYQSTAGELRARVNGLTVALDRQGQLPVLRPASGDYLLPFLTGTAAVAVNTAMTANRFEVWPWVAPADMTIISMSVSVTTAVASALCKTVIYDAIAPGSANAGMPSTLLVETGDMDCSTTGVKTQTVSVPLKRGRVYWVGYRSSSSATVSAVTPVSLVNIPHNAAGSTRATVLLRRGLTYSTAAPSPWSYVQGEANGNGNIPCVWLGV